MKKIRLGLKGLVVAALTKDVSAAMAEDNEAKVEYGEVKHLENVQSIDLTARTQSTNIDADDTTDVLTECTGYDGESQRTMFTPAETAELLGEEIDDDGTVTSTEMDEPPEFAVGFQCKIRGGQILAMWLLRTKFSMNNFSAQSGGAETLNPQSDTLSFKSLTRKADGAWRRYKLVNSEEEAAAFLSKATLVKLAKKTVKED